MCRTTRRTRSTRSTRSTRCTRSMRSASHVTSFIEKAPLSPDPIPHSSLNPLASSPPQWRGNINKSFPFGIATSICLITQGYVEFWKYDYLWQRDDLLTVWLPLTTPTTFHYLITFENSMTRWPLTIRSDFTTRWTLTTWSPSITEWPLTTWCSVTFAKPMTFAICWTSRDWWPLITRWL